MFKVYKIYNSINSKLYIGITKNEISRRFSEHSYFKGNSMISKAIQKYGKGAFYIEEIDSSDNIDDIFEKEKYYIKLYNSLAPNGYNIRSGGSGIYEASESAKEVFRKTALKTAKNFGPKGKSSGYKGVRYNNTKKFWFAEIRVEGKVKFLGIYDSEIEAAKAYDLAVSLYKSGEGYLNFPENIDKNAFQNKRNRNITMEHQIKLQESAGNELTSKINSVYKGVSYRNGKWVARLSKNNRYLLYKSFDSEMAAAIAYDWAVRKHIGEHAYVNFPELEGM